MDVEFASPAILENVVDNKLDPYVSLQGVLNNRYVEIPASSGTGSSTLVWNVDVPSSSTIMAANLMLKMRLTFSFAATVRAGVAVNGAWAAQAVYLKKGFAIESFSINKMIQDLSIVVNGTPISTISPSEFMYVREKYAMSKEVYDSHASMSPCQPNNYSDGTYYDMKKLNNCKSPFPSDASMDSWNFGDARSVWVSSNDVGADNQTITLDICESLYVPSVFHLWKQSGIYNITSLQVTCKLKDNLPLVICCNPAKVTITAGQPAITAGELIADPYARKYDYETTPVIANITNSPVFTGQGRQYTQALNLDKYYPTTCTVTHTSEKLLVQYITSVSSVPSSLQLPYRKVEKWSGVVTSTITNTAAEPTTVPIPINLKTNITPRFLYIVCRRDLSMKNEFITDVNYCIAGVNLVVNNQDGVLSGATMHDLYRINVNNEYTGSFMDYKKGSPLCLEVGKDIPGYPGLLGNFTVNFQLQIFNKSFENITSFICDIYAVEESQIEIQPNRVYITPAVDSSKAKMKLNTPSSFVEADKADMVGGSFKSFMRDLHRKVLRPVYKDVLKPVAKDLYQNVARPVLQGVGDTVKSNANMLMNQGAANLAMGGMNPVQAALLKNATGAGTKLLN